MRISNKRKFNKINLLNEYEFNDIVTLDNVLTALQRVEMTMRMAEEVKKRIIELGEEGRLVDIQLDELSTLIDMKELMFLTIKLICLLSISLIF